MVDATEDPTLPADETTTAQSTTDGTDDYTSGEGCAYSPEEIDLDDVEPNTYPADLVEAGVRWLLWQDSDGRKIARNPEWGRSDRDGGYAFVGAKNPDAWLEETDVEGTTDKGWFTRKLGNVVDFEVDRVRDDGDRVRSYDGIDLTPDGHTRHVQ